MSRAVVYETLINHPAFVTLGFNAQNVLVNYDGDERPPVTPTGMFMVIRWGNQDIEPGFRRGPRHFDIWIHILRERSTDYGHIDKVINELEPLLQDIIDTPGADGNTVTTIEFEGASSDFRDEAYQTLCRQASFKMLSRVTV